jgi:phosphoribosyl 1,2-cyclic phosphate phosphodiesterase
MLGYRYPEGYLDNPKNHRTRASILIEGPTGNLLVDCSPEMRLQMTREEIYDIEAVVITHTHADHVMGMDDLRSICLKTRRPVPVHTLPRFQADIRRIYPYAFAEFPPGVFVPRFDLIDIQDEFMVGGLLVRSFLVEHGSTPVIGLRVGDMAYITDVSHIPDAVRPLLENLETLFLDGVRREPHPNHFHFDRAVAEAQKIGARSTFLTHLSHDYDHDRTNGELPPGISLAWDGQRVEISI